MSLFDNNDHTINNVTSAFDWENVVLAEGRTVADTSVSNVLCATELDRFFNSGEDSPSFTSSQWTLRTTQVGVTVLPEAKITLS
jgi:hypothetical protein